jgi:hypothetical protein
MRLTMSARREIIRATAARYRMAGRKGKGPILNEFCELTGYNRCYAGFLPRSDEMLWRDGVCRTGVSAASFNQCLHARQTGVLVQPATTYYTSTP